MSAPANEVTAAMAGATAMLQKALEQLDSGPDAATPLTLAEMLASCADEYGPEAFWNAISPVEFWPTSPKGDAFEALLKKVEDEHGIPRRDVVNLSNWAGEQSSHLGDFMLRVGMIVGSHMQWQRSAGRLGIELSDEQWQSAMKETKAAMESRS